MSRIALCIALVFILLVPSVPWVAGESETSSELHSEPIEKFERYPHSIKVRVVDEEDPVNGRYDLLVIDVVFPDPVEMTFLVQSGLSSVKGSASNGRIERIQTLKEGETTFSIAYNGTDLYRGKFVFPYLLEMKFAGEKDEGGYSSFLIYGEFTYLRYESPFVAGFNEKITYSGVADGGEGTFRALEASLSLFTKLRGDYTIVAELLGSGQYNGDVRTIVTPGDVGHIEKEVTPKIEDTPSERRGVDMIEADTRSESSSGEPEEIRGLDERSVTVSVESVGTSSVANHGIETIILPLTVEKTGEIIHELTFTFSGSRIHTSSWKGPFILTATLYQKEQYIESVDWMIDDISYSDFTPGLPIGTFTKEYSVRETGTGINVTVGIAVTESAVFTIIGEVYSDSIIENIIREKNAAGYEISMDRANEGVVGPQVLFNYEVPRSQVTMRLTDGITWVTLTFEGIHQREELFIFLTISSKSSGGLDDLEINLKPTEPASNGFIVIEDPDMKDTGVDADKNGQFEFILVKGTIELPAGRYKMEASLFTDHDGSKYKIAVETGEVNVDEGTTSPGDQTVGDPHQTIFKILFDGEDIFRSGVDGPYILIIYLIAENGTTYVMKDHSLPYRSIDFLPGSREEGGKDPGPEPEYSITDDSIFLHTDVFASEIQRNTPELVYYYYSDMGQSVKFRIRYTRLIVFNDDGDGVLEDGEGVYEDYLTTGTWTTSPVSQSSNDQLGSHIRFSMSTPISLQAIGNWFEDVGSDGSNGDVGTDVTNESGPAGYIPNWGTLTLHFLISNNSADSPELTIQGGEELKITVEITQNTDLDARVNAVVLEQKILLEEDGMIVSGFTGNDDGSLVDEASGTWSSLDTQQDCGNETVSRLNYLGSDGKVMGYYSWACTAEQALSNGSGAVVSVGSHSRNVNGTIVLQLSYPISEDMESLTHDPSVGVIGENAPVIGVRVISESLEANPWSDLMGLILATLVVVATLGSGRRGSNNIPGNIGGKPGEGGIQGTGGIQETGGIQGAGGIQGTGGKLGPGGKPGIEWGTQSGQPGSGSGVGNGIDGPGGSIGSSGEPGNGFAPAGFSPSIQLPPQSQLNGNGQWSGHTTVGMNSPTIAQKNEHGRME